MINPPSGLVTFLFTDIEGSTKLEEEFIKCLPEGKAITIEQAIELALRKDKDE